MSDKETVVRWLIELDPNTRPQVVEDRGEAESVFNSHRGRKNRHPVLLKKVEAPVSLHKRFPLSTWSAIEGAILGDYATVETVLELDLQGNEVTPSPSVTL